MLVKFLSHGKGSARAAVEYLVGERDAAGHEREGVEVLRGNPDMVAAVADSLDFGRKYTSAVIAWAPEDRPTGEQIGAVLDEFEKTAWAGLEPDRYAWTAVLHRERGGGVHAHILAAQCDLQTGRSLNIAPPGWHKTYAPLRDAFNHEHGWSRPDDPARARAQRSGHVAYIEASKLRAGLEHEADPRTLIRDYLVQRVEHGAVKGRADVVSALEDVGLEVPRRGKDYITARDPDTGKRWRLKGELYERDFEPGRLDLAAEEPAGGRPEGDRGDGHARARAAWRELERRQKRRAALHRGRYGRGDRADARTAHEGVAPTAGGRHEPLPRYLRRQLGDDALVVEEHRLPDRDLGGGQAQDLAGARHLGGDARDDMGHRVDRDQRGSVRVAARRHSGPSGIHHGRTALHEALDRVRRELHDRLATAVDDRLGAVVRASRR
ncbi:relaxase/mobilization nuclease domain-containing protein [Candidatus Palauibacter sp.]|uniref:relaxase/mobilization nuclease domain-containing protein n=1 Tax=Candidatus Palauibacter sp. TaxID=3101350 RepID=UPI003B529279